MPRKTEGTRNRAEEANRGLILTPKSFMNIQSATGVLYRGNVRKSRPGAIKKNVDQTSPDKNRTAEVRSKHSAAQNFKGHDYCTTNKKRRI